MKIIRNLTKIMLVLLAIMTAIALSLGGFVPIFSAAFGILFLYYLGIFAAAKFAGDTENKLIKLGFSILFLFPIIMFVIDPEVTINFLLQGIHLDMK